MTDINIKTIQIKVQAVLFCNCWTLSHHVRLAPDVTKFLEESTYRLLICY